jgi:hypothetical protein
MRPIRTRTVGAGTIRAMIVRAGTVRAGIFILKFGNFADGCWW